MAWTGADLGSLLARAARALAERDLRFMVVGGQAVLLHGEPRLTQDIDITLACSPERLVDVLAACASIGLVALPSDPPAFVAETFVLPVADGATRIRFDFIFSDTAFEESAVDRAVLIEVEGVPVPFASAEDLLLLKLFAGRPRDLEDAQGVARRQGERLDWDYVRRWAREFADVPGREDLVDLVERLRSPGSQKPTRGHRPNE